MLAANSPVASTVFWIAVFEAVLSQSVAFLDASDFSSLWKSFSALHLQLEFSPTFLAKDKNP